MKIFILIKKSTIKFGFEFCDQQSICLSESRTLVKPISFKLWFSDTFIFDYGLDMYVELQNLLACNQFGCLYSQLAQILSITFV